MSCNTVTDNNYDIYMCSYGSNTISSNTIEENTYGVGISSSSGNSIYYNNFVDNTNQVDGSEPDLTSNTWDDGAGSGNYWSDYEGEDDGSDGRTKGDGIGDTNLPHKDLDYYPLMHPYGMEDHIRNIKDEIEEMDLEIGTENNLLSKLEDAAKLAEKKNFKGRFRN